ncbi:hypothetical protein [Raoultella planticola]|uniref:hypothetical protein n=1 Tax=Raoultella planticola TaxID=575 RepID=UPI000B21D9E1|nr:hypothetical protein [Raoultella planticola]MCD9605119.1 hypothetical protein [Raoultella planticola]MDM9658583.1 hypothetical protein [Raoultella planticola]MDM9663946.1 hypothetical protein [Raoultella planticola]MDY7621921.1 hypothetical protein [Raoultella planticola]VTM92927.1 Uncharacterised protein [Raoultella planticola]
MKFFYFILLFSYGCYASAEECINKSDVDSLIGVFKNNDKQSLIIFSSDAIKGGIEQDELVLNKKALLLICLRFIMAGVWIRILNIQCIRRQFSLVRGYVCGIFLLHYQSP